MMADKGEVDVLQKAREALRRVLRDCEEMEVEGWYTLKAETEAEVDAAIDAIDALLSAAGRVGRTGKPLKVVGWLNSVGPLNTLPEAPAPAS